MKKHSHLKTKYIIAFASRCPLAMLLVLSIGVLTIVGACYSVVKGKIPEIAEDKPVFASLFLSEAGGGDSEEENPYEFETEEEIDIPELTTEEPVTNKKGEIETSKESETYVTEFVKKKKVSENSPYYGFWKVLESSSGLNAVVGVAHLGVVNPTTSVTYVLHNVKMY